LVEIGIDESLLSLRGGAGFNVAKKFLHVSFSDIVNLLGVNIVSAFTILILSGQAEFVSSIEIFFKLFSSGTNVVSGHIIENAFLNLSFC